MVAEMPAIWTFRHYVTSGGRDEEIRQWFDACSKKSKTKISVRLKYLSQNPRHLWPSGYFSSLSGPCAPLGEVKLLLDKVQHRPLTYFEGSMLTFVICAIEKGGKFVPKNACDTGKSRKAEIEADATRCKPSDIPLQ